MNTTTLCLDGFDEGDIVFVASHKNCIIIVLAGSVQKHISGKRDINSLGPFRLIFLEYARRFNASTLQLAFDLRDHNIVPLHRSVVVLANNSSTSSTYTKETGPYKHIWHVHNIRARFTSLLLEHIPEADSEVFAVNEYHRSSHIHDMRNQMCHCGPAIVIVLSTQLVKSTAPVYARYVASWTVSSSGSGSV